MFCALECSAPNAKLPKKKRTEFHCVQTYEIKNTIAEICEKRNDELAHIVKTRINNVIDLIAVEARYHKNCYSMFRSMPSSDKIGGPVNTEKEAHFEELCTYIDNGDDCQYSLNDLKIKLKDISRSEDDMFSDPYLKSLILKRYGSDVMYTSSGTKAKAFTFRKSLHKILSEQWYNSRCGTVEDDRLRIVKAAAEIIRADIQAKMYDTTAYPTFSEIQEGGSDLVPESLKLFTKEVTRYKIKSRENEKIVKKRLVINHMLIAACRPRSFVSPIQMGLCIYLNRKFGSRHIIDLLSTLGICSSYYENVNYLNGSLDCAQPIIDKNGFCQFVFDNADINVCTLDGLGTFHTLGGIMCVAPSSSVSIPNNINRNNKQQIDKCKNQIPINVYQKPGANGLKAIFVKKLTVTQSDYTKIRNGFALDVIWMAGYTEESHNPNSIPSWNGYMQSSFKETG